MQIAHSHTCGSSLRIGDARRVRRDPTGTLPIRRSFTTEARTRFNQLRALVRVALLDNDMLGVRGVTMTSIAAVLSSNRAQAFHDWFNEAAYQTFVGRDGAWTRRYVRAAYWKGLADAQREIPIPVLLSAERAEVLGQLMTVELQGVTDAMVQQVGRVIAEGLTFNRSLNEMYRGVLDRMDKIGWTRLRAAMDMTVVRAYNTAKLDVYMEAGIEQVGTIPETIIKQPPKRVRDSLDDLFDQGGPGSRVPRDRTPSRSTLYRIRKAQEQLERMSLVEVLTAGDGDVCEECEDISLNGPYGINTARSLIPAHPNCRCAFVPADDARYANPRDEDD